MRLGEIDKLYRDKRVLYDRAMRQVEECISDIVKDFTADGLFRVVRVEKRRKSLDSLKRKAYEKSIPIDQIFEKITDMGGIRIVVNNLSDVHKLVEKIKASSKLHFDESSYEDKVAIPLESGYRAIHFIVYVEVELKGKPYKIPCEIQGCTLFQDSWSVLVHQDIYKGPKDLPPVIQKLSRRLADQLAVLDEIAQDIRDELSKQAEPYGATGDEEPLTKQSIGIIFYELFGKKPYEYELQFALNELKDVGLSKVEDLKRYLPNEEVRRRLDALHRRFFGDWAIGDMDTLIWGIKATVIGDRAYAEFVEEVKGEWEEVESIARREALSGLPQTVDELIEELENAREINIGLLDGLKELGGMSDCDICGQDIFEPDQAYEALCGHYDRECPALLDLLYDICANGVLECEDASHSGLCLHCAHLLYSDNT